MTTFVLPEALTIASVRSLRTDLLECFDGRPPYALDGRAVEDVDGAGVQLLLAAVHELKPRGQPLQITPSHALRDTLERLAVLDRFIVANEAVA